MGRKHRNGFLCVRAAISLALRDPRDPRVDELELVHEFYDASSLTS